MNEVRPSRAMSTLSGYREQSDTFPEGKYQRRESRPFQNHEGRRFLFSKKLARRPTNGFLAEAYQRLGHIEADAIVFREWLFIPNLDLQVDSTLTNLGARKSREEG